MTRREVKAEIKSIRKAAEKALSSPATAAKFLARIRVPSGQMQAVRTKSR